LIHHNVSTELFAEVVASAQKQRKRVEEPFGRGQLKVKGLAKVNSVLDMAMKTGNRLDNPASSGKITQQTIR
jgi:hypothetical protein